MEQFQSLTSFLQDSLSQEEDPLSLYSECSNKPTKKQKQIIFWSSILSQWFYKFEIPIFHLDDIKPYLTLGEILPPLSSAAEYLVKVGELEYFSSFDEPFLFGTFFEKIECSLFSFCRHKTISKFLFVVPCFFNKEVQRVYESYVFNVKYPFDLLFPFDIEIKSRIPSEVLIKTFISSSLAFTVGEIGFSFVSPKVKSLSRNSAKILLCAKISLLNLEKVSRDIYFEFQKISLLHSDSASLSFSVSSLLDQARFQSEIQ